MNLYISFARITTAIFSSLFITLYFALAKPFFGASLPLNLALGLTISAAFATLMVLLDLVLRKCHIKIFNTIVLGLFIGSFSGKAFCGIFDMLVSLAAEPSSLPVVATLFPKAFLYLLGVHLGIVITLAYQEELHISIPFVRFSEVLQGNKNIILDETALADPRLLDFVSTGILNNRLVLPSFMVKHIKERIDHSEEHIASNLKRLLGVIEKLKEMKDLDLKENETDFNDITDLRKKIFRLAKATSSNVLVADCSKLEKEGSEAPMLSLNAITNSLKNVMSAGENIEIKVQRYGKEPKQGVGYLEDGTMVVINNGGNFIGETIDVQVISVKQTTAGRIIFTNAMVEEEEDDFAYQPSSSYQPHHD